ncbi:MAG: prepilin-type cleavage/methylation domain-containing protein [Candidatus Cloacimonetes bacterium HGW-Cloacimonetes-3]|nr:MAG: prepilin-type cleavage/methylation domain-containing protein [Candidatus Cloacimonetes bacterium HGW-Cloacimonetes-3]
MINYRKYLKAPVARLKSQKGFTLIELISVGIISSLLIVIAGVGLSVFFSKYQEINAFVELQKDALECLNYLKNGYNVGSGGYIQFNGVASAKALEITGRTDEAGKGNGLKITPPFMEEFPNDFVHFYLQDKIIRVNYMYNGVQVNTPLYLFPKRAERSRVTIESFKVSDANAYSALFVNKIDEPLCAVNVELKAKVETSKNKFRYINFNTVMAMKNMSRPLGVK